MYKTPPPRPENVVEMDIESMNVTQLKKELQKFNHSTKGNKAELQKRLVEVVKAAKRLNFNDDDEASHHENQHENKDDDDIESVNSDDGKEAVSEDEDGDDENEKQRKELEAKMNELRKQMDKLKVQTKKEDRPKEVKAKWQFHSRDVEDTVSTFNGSDHFHITFWLDEFEQAAELFEWNPKQKFIYAKKLLRGSAKSFVRSLATSVTSWRELKRELLDEYERELDDIEAHKLMKKTKKKSDESVFDYLTRMREIGVINKIDKASIIQ